MLNATAKYAAQIDHQGPPEDVPEWIRFENVDLKQERKEATSGTTPNQPPVALKIIEFDERTGRRTTSQVEYPTADKVKTEKTKHFVLPWRTWRATKGTMGALEADKATAVAALQHLHTRFPVEDEGVECMGTMAQEGGKIQVGLFATTHMETQTMWLPPCIPKKMAVHEKSEHPSAAMINIVTAAKPYVLPTVDEKAIAPRSHSPCVRLLVNA